MARQRGLGKGLDALFADNDTRQQQQTVFIPLTEIEPNREQPRKRFDEESLAQLADSIQEHGVLQPLVVRPAMNGTYLLVAGERRWRAARMAGLREVPVVIRDLSEQESMEIALIENLQREDLNPLEEASGYQDLIDLYGYTQDQVAKRVGKSRSAVANALRLCGLPETVRGLVENGSLSAGHARALLSFESEEEMEQIAKFAAEKGLSVRDLENRAKESRKRANGSGRTRKERPRDHYFDEMEIALQEELHQRVKIAAEGEKGTLQIDFYSKEELRDLAERLTGRR